MYSYCYVYVFLLVCMFSIVYSVPLCCSVYCLCVNVYCTTATGCQPNCNKQVYQYQITLVPVLSEVDVILCGSVVLFSPNGSVWIVPLLHSVNDMITPVGRADLELMWVIRGVKTPPPTALHRNCIQRRPY
jgi:hypothetical protein